MANEHMQAVLFDKSKWTTQKARAWLRKHDLYPIKQVHITTNFYRYRIQQPRPGPYVTKDIGKGIKLIIMM